MTTPLIWRRSQQTRLRSVAVERSASAETSPPAPREGFAARMEAAVARSGQALQWSIRQARGPQNAWTYMAHVGLDIPAQGWKLHVSASVWNAGVVLDRVLDVLLAEPTSFKIAATPMLLRRLNRGECGLSQIGKFVTIYPRNDDQARRLAGRLNDVTSGLRGPHVPSDRRFAPGSLISYRYGDFIGQEMQLPTGLVVPAITDPGGRRCPDRRETYYTAPDWATDPFQAAPTEQDVRPGPGSLIDGCLIVADLAFLARGPTFLAVDLIAGARCILKGAFADACIMRNGADACDQLRSEYAALEHFQHHGWAPRPHRLITHAGVLYLKMEDIGGETLAQHIANAATSGDLPEERRLISWAIDLLGMLDAIHASGWGHGDIKTSNIILSDQGGAVRLIDFGMSRRLDDEAIEQTGTRGYRPPPDCQIARDGVARDLFALGAVLYAGATGIDPALAPHEHDLLRRPIALLNPDLSEGFRQFVERLLDPAACTRPASARIAAELLDNLPATCSPERVRHAPSAGSLSVSGDWCRDAVQALGELLCEELQQSASANGEPWVSTHDIATGVYRDLNIGGAGALLALGEIAAFTGEAAHLQWLRRAAHWFAAAPNVRPERLAGLFAGESGLGLAMLRAGLVLGDADIEQAAMARSHWVAEQPYDSPDIFVGTAGRLQFHLFMWDATGDPVHLGYAEACGASLKSTAIRLPSDEACWKLPPDYEQMSDMSYLGYAHGAAGIADALLDLHEANGDEVCKSLAGAAGRWIARQGVPVLRDGSGLNWPVTPDGDMHGAFWCHGAAGIGSFFRHAAALDAVPGAADLAVRAARTVADATRWAGPTQCHGLAGNIEFLLDMHHSTGDSLHFDQAYTLASILAAQATRENGRWIWPSESPTTFSPDYMVGYAGVASCLMRLSARNAIPRQLSRSAFRAIAQPN